MDQWTSPFWAGATEGRLLFPQCADCGCFRWPSGPFCPRCHSQAVNWMDGGEGRIYSFSAVRTAAGEAGPASLHMPALIEFPQAGGVRLLAALVDAVPEAVEIGASVTPIFMPAANTSVPAFRLKD
jgi:uncharacterized OB-fold protein